jgi:hypothetical protein
LLLLSVVTFANADGPKVVPLPPPEVDKWNKLEGAVAGKLFVMTAEPASKWRMLSKNDSELRSFESGKVGVFLANTPGVYQVLVIGPGGDINQLEIVVEGTVPTPPNPKPPLVDPLKEKLTKLFNEDSSLDKKDAAKDLAELYRQAAILANSVEVKTSKALLEKCQKAATTLIGNDKLVSLRKVISSELAAILPTDAPLTDEQRKSTVELFTKLSVIFKQLGE